MKPHILSYLVLVLINSSLFSQTKYDLSFSLDGYNREYIVSVPTKNVPANGWPLVMMMHGTSGDKDVFYNAKGWKELGQEENFITVFPSSLRWCFTDNGITKVNSRFVNGNLLDSLCPIELPRLISDIDFFRELIKRISETIPINKDKVFATGFSNGCCMMFKTAMEAGDLFKACAGTSGIYHQLDSITPQNRVPIWFAVGTKDDRFITENFPVLPYGGDSLIVFFNKMINRTLVSQGLTSKYKKTETAITKTYAYTECLPGQLCEPFVLTGIKNMPHIYPNGSNFPIDGPAAFWEFFNNPPISSSTGDYFSQKVKIFPNPAYQNTIQISHPWEDADIRIYNGLGHLISLENNVKTKTSLDISSLSPDLYFVKLLHPESQYSLTLKFIKI